MNKKITAGLLAGFLSVLALIGAGPASATDEPPATPTPVVTPVTYETFAWVIDNPDSIWQNAQHDPIRVPTGEVVDLQAVVADANTKLCGRDKLQGDGYIAGPTTDALYADGHGLLYGPNNPPEALAFGAPGTNGGDPWFYFSTPDCVEVTPCTSQFENTQITYRWFWDGTAVVRVETGSTPIPLTEAEAIAAGCYVPPVIEEEPVCVPGPDTLACTGTAEVVTIVLLSIAGVLAIVGIGFFLYARTYKKNHPERGPRHLGVPRKPSHRA